MDSKFQRSEDGFVSNLYKIPYEGIKSLYQIDSVDRARAVPYLSLQEVDRDTNEPIGVPFEMQATAPPNFGQSVSRFAERPDVSIDSVSVKQNIAMGWWIFSEVDLNVVVHRPDQLSGQDTFVSRLISYGRTFMLTYGWQGGNNPILGNGYDSDESAKRVSAEGVGQQKKTDARAKFPSLNRIRFMIKSYNFEFKANGEIILSVSGVEDFELNVRNKSFMEQIGLIGETYEKKRDILIDRLKKISVSVTVDNKVSKKMMSCSDLLNAIVAQPLVEAFNSSGYDTVDLELGSFNQECPPDRYGQVLADHSIGDFKIELDAVLSRMEKIMKKNRALTVRGFIHEVIVGTLNSTSSWKNPQKKEVAVPDIAFITMADPKSRYIRAALIDRKSFLKEIKKNLRHGSIQDEKDLPKYIEQSKLPVVTVGKANSFIQAMKFDVMTDDQMKSLLISRAMNQYREQRAEQNPKKVDEQTIRPGLLIFRSAIRGSMTLIGNFVFNTFGMMWMDFGVKEWDGIFFIVERNDKISREGFVTNITVMAEGSNPLAVPDKSITPYDEKNSSVEEFKTKREGLVPR